jgi:hypothetical protein
MPDNRSDLLFDRLLSNAEDITRTFEIDLGGLPDIVLDTTRNTEPVVEAVRTFMERFRVNVGEVPSDQRMLINMADWSAKLVPTVQTWLRTGQVAAVDGTPLLSPRRYLAGQVYACAIGAVTSTNPLQLRAQLVKTIASLNIPKIATSDDIRRLIEQSDELLGDTSWPNAFMEYQEREYALQLEAPYIFVDGPLAPENVITRKRGQELLSQMLIRRDKVLVGVIKSLINSRAMYRLVARALRPGELFVMETQSDYLLENIPQDRFQDYRAWVEEEMAAVLRGVYRPGSKAFGFQCNSRDFDTAVALLWCDRDRVPGHEIPFLLNQVDEQIRARYRSMDTSAAIDGLLARQGENYFFDETDERELR